MLLLLNLNHFSLWFEFSWYLISREALFASLLSIVPIRYLFVAIWKSLNSAYLCSQVVGNEADLSRWGVRPLTSSSSLGFRIWRCGTCFFLFLRDSWVFIIVGFVITRALTVYKCIILPQTGFETLADLQAPVSFELRFFVCPFEKGRQNLIFSVEPKCDLNIRPASVHWITVKY